MKDNTNSFRKKECDAREKVEDLAQQFIEECMNRAACAFWKTYRSLFSNNEIGTNAAKKHRKASSEVQI